MPLQMTKICSFLWLVYSMYTPPPPHLLFPTHLSGDSCLGGFHVLAVVNGAAVNVGVPVSFWESVSQGVCPGVGLLGCMAVLLSAFLEPPYFPTEAESILHSHQQSQGVIPFSFAPFPALVCRLFQRWLS